MDEGGQWVNGLWSAASPHCTAQYAHLTTDGRRVCCRAHSVHYPGLVRYAHHTQFTPPPHVTGQRPRNVDHPLRDVRRAVPLLRHVIPRLRTHPEALLLGRHAALVRQREEGEGKVARVRWRLDRRDSARVRARPPYSKANPNLNPRSRFPTGLHSSSFRRMTSFTSGSTSD